MFGIFKRKTDKGKILVSERDLAQAGFHVARFQLAYDQATNLARKEEHRKELLYWSRINDANEGRV
jgi:predicted alpha/beta-hydrolase family hydrolase